MAAAGLDVSELRKGRKPGTSVFTVRDAIGGPNLMISATAAERRRMKAFTRLDGRAAALTIANLDTDQIIPKQFLKTVEREGLGKGLFYDLRFDGEGRAQARLRAQPAGRSPAPAS